MPSLLAFLKSHDCTLAAYPAPVSPGLEPDRVVVACYVSDPSGRVTVRAEIIPATLQAAWDWLGY